MHMEVLNGYLPCIPTLKDSVTAAASPEKGNKPFNEAMLVGMIMETCPIARRNQYNLTHKTVPESPRTLFLNLENIEKVFIEMYNKKAMANKAKAAKVPKASEARMHRKHVNGGSSVQVPTKGCSAKYCHWCKANGGPYKIHDTVKCCKYEENGSLKDKLAGQVG
jgi:hypothetical protein